ncbi:MAG TPA: formate dehydrogenase accessory sulfurtransferase FdhD [Gemmatimonadaceae bacterium]|nr:formate dehydrogenase accessory sulfurtransferase FdhD [Gemmatimonadaceae bacterium]
MADTDPKAGLGPVPGLGYGQAVNVRRFVRLGEDAASEDRAPVAEEVPVAFVYTGRAHAVMMATPTDLEDLAVGFTLSELIVAERGEIRRVTVAPHSRGVELAIEIPAEAVERLGERARAISGRTGCGLCGVEAIDDAVRAPRVVTSTLAIESEALWRAGAALDARQPFNQATHAVHGAAWASADGELRVVREDVGRHNALDKVLGALARGGIDASSGFLVVTSRASFELVQKAAVFGVPLLAAVSRPTGLAVRLAEMCGMSLVGLLRGRTANVYAHPERVRAPITQEQS